MTTTRPGNKQVLIMGVGNTLLQDDGAGVHVANSVKDMSDPPPVNVLDGGTLGLSLLPEIEDAAGLIVVDAGQIGEAPGSIRVFRNAEMDRQLSGKKSTVHEVAVADLLAAAAMSGQLPADRALVVIQPASIEWGLSPTSPVQAAIPKARDKVAEIARGWIK